METDRKEFAGALSALKGAVSSRPGIPALTGVLVEGDGAGVAVLTATDLETTATARIGAADGSGFRALVPFKILADTVKAASTERVGLERVDGHVKVAGASIRLLPAEDFPTIAEPAELVGTFDAAELRDVIGAVAPAASGDEARPVLTGVSLQCEENGDAVMVATDSYRLHVGRLTNGAVRAGHYLIPERTLSYVGKLIGRKPASPRMAIRCSDGAVMFELGTVRVTVRLIEGEFPNWRQLMPEGPGETGATVHYELAELAGAVKAASPFCGRDHFGPPVRLTLDPVLGVSLSASSPDLGDWSAKLERAEVRGESVAVAFTPSYLAGILSAAGEGATLYVRDGLKPAHAVSNSGRVEALVMPVRLPVAVQPGPNPWRAPTAPDTPDEIAGPGPIHEPTADERGAGEPVEDRTDPGAAEAGELAETEEPKGETPRGPGGCAACGHVHWLGPFPGRGPCGACGCAEHRDSKPGPETPAEPAEPEPAEDPAELRRRLVKAAEPGEQIRRRLGRTDDSAEQWSELADIGTVAGAGRSAVRVRVVVGPDGSPMVDARRFVSSPRYSGPTRKGFALRPAEAGALAELLRDAQAAAEAL